MAKSKVTRSRGTKKPAAPAEILRQVAADKARVHADGSGSPEQQAVFSAACEAAADIPVPLTLGEACKLVGPDVSPDNFAADSLRSISHELDVYALLPEQDTTSGWSVLKTLSERAEFASRVAEYLAGGAS